MLLMKEDGRTARWNLSGLRLRLPERLHELRLGRTRDSQAAQMIPHCSARYGMMQSAKPAHTADGVQARPDACGGPVL